MIAILVTRERVSRSYLMKATANKDCNTPLAAVEIICLVNVGQQVSDMEYQIAI